MALVQSVGVYPTTKTVVAPHYSGLRSSTSQNSSSVQDRGRQVDRTTTETTDLGRKRGHEVATAEGKAKRPKSLPCRSGEERQSSSTTSTTVMLPMCNGRPANLSPVDWQNAVAAGSIPRETIIAHTDFTHTSAIAKRRRLRKHKLQCQSSVCSSEDDGSTSRTPSQLSSPIDDTNSSPKMYFPARENGSSLSIVVSSETAPISSSTLQSVATAQQQHKGSPVEHTHSTKQPKQQQQQQQQHFHQHVNQLLETQSVTQQQLHQYLIQQQQQQQQQAQAMLAGGFVLPAAMAGAMGSSTGPPSATAAHIQQLVHTHNHTHTHMHHFAGGWPGGQGLPLAVYPRPPHSPGKGKLNVAATSNTDQSSGVLNPLAQGYPYPMMYVLPESFLPRTEEGGNDAGTTSKDSFPMKSLLSEQHQPSSLAMPRGGVMMPPTYTMLAAANPWSQILSANGNGNMAAMVTGGIPTLGTVPFLGMPQVVPGASFPMQFPVATPMLHAASRPPTTEF